MKKASVKIDVQLKGFDMHDVRTTAENGLIVALSGTNVTKEKMGQLIEAAQTLYGHSNVTVMYK